MRKLDDIIPPSRRTPVEAPAASASVRTLRLEPRRSRFPTATAIVVVLIIVASVGALFYFSGAEVDVTPTSASATVASSFTAAQGTGDLPFVIVSATKIATQSVASSGTKTVQSNASGIITIYNTQSKAQKLIANTRFATTAGLIFRIHSAVTIPAGTTASPGSVQATVYADQTGASYNVDPTSWTVPGLAGTPQAAEVYAKSSVAMTGGASGQVPVVDAATDASAQAALKSALGPDLQTTLQAQLPQGYILLAGAATTTYVELTPAPSNTTGQVEVKEQGTISAVAFPNAALAKAIAASISALGYQGNPITLSSTSGLTYAGPIPNPSATTLSFNLSGTTNLVYTIDPSRIASAVAGETRSAAEVALSNYPEVKKALLVLRPFWKTTFPEDPAAIKVVVEAP